MTKIIKKIIPTSVDDDFDKDISGFVKENFFGETCIKISSFGDCEKAEQTARSKARLVLNYFRFLFCVVGYEWVHENSIKISMKSETFGHGELFFYQSEPKGSVTLSSGTGRKNPQDFELDKLFLKKCKKDIYFNEFFILHSKNLKQR